MHLFIPSVFRIDSKILTGELHLYRNSPKLSPVDIGSESNTKEKKRTNLRQLQKKT